MRVRYQFLAAALVLAGATSAVPAAAAQITISYSEKVGDNLPLWIADDAGYFKAKGLDVATRFIPAQEGIPALLSNQVQMAAIGGADVLAAAAAGAKISYVATFSPVYTFQFWARPEFAKPGALKGQKVGVSSTTGSLYTATVIALKELGLSPSDVAITPLGTVQNIDAALIAGSIAAAASHPPGTYQYRQHGFVDLVDLAQKRLPNINTGLAALDRYLKSDPKVVQGVIAAIVEGLKREKSDKAFAESELRSRMGIKDQAVLDFTYDFYANEVAPAVPMPAPAQLEAAKQALALRNPKVKTVDVAAIIDPSFVKAAVGGK